MRVVVAIDSSDHSRALADEVRLRPWPRRTQIAVLHIIDAGALSGAGKYRDDINEKAKLAAIGLVQNAARRIASTQTEVFCKVIEDYPSVGLVDYATRWGADMIMAGSSSESPSLLGSVARAIAQSALCSVGIVRPSPRGDSGAMRILLAVDGSAFSLAAARSVAARPWPFGTKVRVASVVDRPVRATENLAPAEASIEEQLKAKTRQCEETISTTRDILAASGLEVATAPLGGDALGALLSEARDWGASLIVAGAGRRGMGRLLQRSLSYELALKASCAVEIIRERPHDGMFGAL